MKTILLGVILICFFWISAYAADDCDSEYGKLIKELESSNMLESEKAKYLPGLNKAYDLCKQGKDEEADKIVKDLKNQGLSEEMFDSGSGN